MKDRKGIILAGGSGTRLFPLTEVTSKQLLPVYDKPLIYYPLTTLMLAGIKEILIITTEKDHENFKYLLGDGEQWGISISYEIQHKPKGIAQALTIAENFISGSNICLILGDNIFFGNDLSNKLDTANKNDNGSTIFLYHVNDPENYGVIKMSESNTPLEIFEKPKNFISNFAVTGLYFYDNEAIEIAKLLKPSSRGELEITDVNRVYLDNKKLTCQILERGFAWLDTGTHDNLLSASDFVATIQKRQGLMISCPEEIALRKKWIDVSQIYKRIDRFKNSSYGKKKKKIIKEIKS